MLRIAFAFVALTSCLFCSDVQAQRECKKNANSKQLATETNQVFASMIADGERRGPGNAQGQRGQKGPRAQGAQGAQGQRGQGNPRDGQRREGETREGQGFAQEQINPAQRLMMMFKKMDRNGDGKISKREAPGRLKENFEKADRNSDGVLDRQEQIAVMKKILESMKNRDGPEGVRDRPQPNREFGKAKEGRREEGKGAKPAEREGDRAFGEFGDPAEKGKERRAKGDRPDRPAPKKKEAPVDGGVFGEF